MFGHGAPFFVLKTGLHWVVPAIKNHLELYKRHSANCTVHRLKPKLKPKTLKFYFDCGWHVWIVGRTPDGDIVPRQSTGESDIRKAEGQPVSLVSPDRNHTIMTDSLGTQNYQLPVNRAL
jgi:hypothetical protein